MNFIETFFGSLSSYLWSWPMIILLLGTHLFLTIRLRVPQRRIFTAIRLSFSKDKDSKGDVSPFGALATALAGTIGTGNIVGVATAISLGGPGAVFWCWLTGVLGIATKYSEGVLAIKYRVQTSNGEMLGGPMYALERGMKMKWLAILFCIFTVLASLGIGSTVQANSISLLLNETWNISPYLSGAVITLCLTLVIIFGVKGISKVCTALVPFMAVFYVISCCYILFVNSAYLGEAIRIIISDAFSADSIVGGMTGGGVMLAARYGIARGLFSNESGLGSAPIVAAAARTRNPVRQALVSSTATFWDTVVICALTGLVLVSSIIAYPDIDYSQGGILTKAAFTKIPFWGPIILSIGICTFAFSTILGWSYYAEKAMEYLGGKRSIRYFRFIYIVLVYCGSVASLALVWNIADCMNALMALPNLFSLLLLSGVVAKETNRYLWGGKLDEWDSPIH
ncbi:MAG: alanine:cation symporter family protein [Bacteroides sp.]|jgi:AGCS family alanine or glycine:cation symporter|nr:alanine:cation symporter family protein [Bacteroides sp.]MCI1681077.1 alanine:cation symporter family protein [Bacteroides sp.]